MVIGHRGHVNNLVLVAPRFLKALFRYAIQRHTPSNFRHYMFISWPELFREFWKFPSIVLTCSIPTRAYNLRCRPSHKEHVMQPAIGYIRVSSEEQADSGLGLEAQRQKIQPYCTLKGLELVEVYEDAGVSGGKPLDRRAAGARLLCAARKT